MAISFVYSSPSLLLSNIFAGLLIIQLQFLAWYIYRQYTCATAATRLARLHIATLIIYYILFMISAVVSLLQLHPHPLPLLASEEEVQVNTKKYYATYFLAYGMEVLVVMNDLLFLTARSGVFTKNPFLLQHKYHKLLTISNITCFLLAPCLFIPSVVIRSQYFTLSKYDSISDMLFVFGILLYTVILLSNILTVMYLMLFSIPKDVQAENSQKLNEKKRKLKFYSLNLIFGGLIAKTYFAYVALGGHDNFPWSFVIFDGNFLCICFIMLMWHKLVLFFKSSFVSVFFMKTESSQQIVLPRENSTNTVILCVK